ncbi:hypothetical protein [Bordetella sp. 02P26C-1]|uniref:hypothetical protein n=1 Tax=Bordetella sp. 02P26C-1 TaxID=2683195 RepID=UPI0013541434|nr:hypothetical protein [Bordetella sp. 02P26C-1]MVW79710.1 hypothetical protein [Bordetella sp. 02P26C-1]
MATKQAPLITPAEVREILAEPKETAKAVTWVHRPAPGQMQWMEFVSSCRLRGETRDDIIFRAIYRPARTAVYGQAAITLPAACSASLFIGPHRVLGIDTNDAYHTNVSGSDLPLYRKVLEQRTHLHIWHHEGEGYAEPIEPALNDIATLIPYFLQRANLTLPGGFAHPLKGRQIELLI